MQTPILVMGAAGRMGSTVTRLVREDASFRLVGRLEQTNRLDALSPIEGCLDGDALQPVLEHAEALCAHNSDLTKPVIIDFTSPASSLATARIAARHGAGQVIGTTGLTEEELVELRACAAKTPIFRSPNMSVGVNVLLKVLPELVRLLGEDYDMEMVEIHHNQKKDAPSGTALRLAEAMVKARDWELRDVACYHREGIVGERPKKEMGLQTLRGGDVVGVHTAYFFGPGERIEVTHQAHSRENFAQGALRAAKWLSARQGGRLYSMDDMF